MINVVIADREAIIRRALKLMLEQDNEIKVIGCSENVQQVIESCREMPVNAVIMDVDMQTNDGVEGLKLIKELRSSIRVLILASFYDKRIILKSLSSGADSCILKDIEPENLILALKSTVKGFTVMHTDILNVIMKKDIQTIDVDNKESAYKEFSLSPTEIEIIRFIAQGKTNKETASTVFLSEGRVANIISDIFGKHELKNRTQLAAFAIRNNLV